MKNPTLTTTETVGRASGSVADARPRALGPSRPASGRLRLVGTLLRQTAKGLLAGNAAEWAAAIAYYGLLSALPFLLAATSLAAAVVDGGWAVEQATGVLAGFLPEGGEQVERIVRGAVESRGRIGLLSTLALVWTGGRAFAALTLALNAICGADAADDAPRCFLVSVGMLVVVGLAFAGALVSGLLVDDL